MTTKSSRGDDTITVINTEARFRRYPLQTVPERFKDQPINLRKVTMKVLVLKPGAQHVDRELWDHPNIKAITKKDIEDQVLRVLEKPVNMLSEKAAIKVVRMTIDRPILLGIKVKEKREKVLEAIDRQLVGIAKVAHVPPESEF